MKNVTSSNSLPGIKERLDHLSIYCLFVLLISHHCFAQSWAGESYVSTTDSPNAFPLVADGKAAPLYLSSQDYAGVLRVAGHLQTDIHNVTGVKPEVITDLTADNTIVIIGTIGKNPVLDRLIAEKKLDPAKVAGRWDTYGREVVDKPLPGVDHALVIFGSNKRGTIYGMYDLSSQIGVSPWYWWADVPVQRKAEIYLKSGHYSPGEPKVKYRGIFINDEAPALRNWAKEKFGGFNHKFYEKVFELILRNKGNYLWPAMWYPSAFADDDPENPRPGR